VDDLGRLVLIKRTKPGQAPYWTAPGGGVEDADASVEAALHRELAEELGATVTGASQVFLFSSPSDAGIAVQHCFVARLASMEESARSGRAHGPAIGPTIGRSTGSEPLTGCRCPAVS
jgi:ADP-ribose pyrophosphatase YjhB (NUDIX family)